MLTNMVDSSNVAHLNGSNGVTKMTNELDVEESLSSDHSSLFSNDEINQDINENRNDKQSDQLGNDIMENFGEIIKKTMVETVTA